MNCKIVKHTSLIFFFVCSLLSFFIRYSVKIHINQLINNRIIECQKKIKTNMKDIQVIHAQQLQQQQKFFEIELKTREFWQRIFNIIYHIRTFFYVQTNSFFCFVLIVFNWKFSRLETKIVVVVVNEHIALGKMKHHHHHYK